MDTDHGLYSKLDVMVRFITEISKSSPVCGLLQVTSDWPLQYLREFCEETLDIRGRANQRYQGLTVSQQLNHLEHNSISEFIFLVSESLNNPDDGQETIYVISQVPVTSKNWSLYRGNCQHCGHCYAALQKRRARGFYLAKLVTLFCTY